MFIKNSGFSLSCEKIMIKWTQYPNLELPDFDAYLQAIRRNGPNKLWMGGMVIRGVKCMWLSLLAVALQPLTAESGSSGTFHLSSTMTFYDCVYAVMNYWMRFILLFFFSPTKLPHSVIMTRILTNFFSCCLFGWLQLCIPTCLPSLYRALKFFK